MSQETNDKYKNSKNENYKTFAKIPMALLSDNLSAEHIGLYTLLNAMGGVNPYYEGKYTAMLQTDKGITELIKWDRKISKVKTLITELQQKKEIELFDRGESFDIVFPNVTKKNGSYITAYANPIRKIVSKSKGKNLLTHLAVYVGMRSGIYENSTDNRVFIKSPNYIAKVTNMPITTVRRQLKWLRDNDVVAYYRARVTEDLGFERYYYAEYKDGKLLTTVMKGYMKQGYVKEVIE